MQGGIIICGFAGIGKTTLASKYKNVIDLESSSYKWIYNSNVDGLSYEERKGLDNKVLNPLWPNNYIIDIISKSLPGKIVLTSMDKEIREGLKEWGCKYYIIYPDKESKAVYIERYQNRGNNEAFIEKIESNFENWIDELDQEDNKIILYSYEYLEDALLSMGLIENT